jgi:glycosyltransferase involved in cell wall biosynthesis
MAKISLLMLTSNDVGPALQNLETTKGIVDEQVVLDSSSKPEKARLIKYAKTHPKVKTFDCISLGFPEPFMPFALSKCRNDWILLLDSDEHPSQELLRMLKNFRPDGEANFITRYETPDKRFSTWQLRLFKRGAVKWMGFLHENPKVKGRKVKLSKQFHLMHMKVGAGRNYDKLKLFINHSRARMLLADLYIGLKMSPAELPAILKRSIDYTRKTGDEKELFRILTSQGLIRYLDLEKKGTVERLVSKYKNKKQGPDLLLHLVMEKYRKRHST